ncbi:unnamed protein product [Ceratitis capitata]|uniref:(Mediterranean fruit fly) hypothetical protein n=1 Tax=Ceratitis capitata TaxID=7213 RepID=A0A811U1J6_CERCA|nr:unnamed protein product [Ceratitis capitata]
MGCRSRSDQALQPLISQDVTRTVPLETCTRRKGVLAELSRETSKHCQEAINQPSEHRQGQREGERSRMTSTGIDSTEERETHRKNGQREHHGKINERERSRSSARSSRYDSPDSRRSSTE